MNKMKLLGAKGGLGETKTEIKKFKTRREITIEEIRNNPNLTEEQKQKIIEEILEQDGRDRLDNPPQI